MSDFWLKCSACRKELGFSSIHWVCSVSTCNRSRTRLVFCSVACWDSHVADARHRDAWAVEERSPGREAWQAELAKEPRSEPVAPPSKSPSVGGVEPVRRRVVEPGGGGAVAAGAGASPTAVVLASGVEQEVLVVVSKMKKYIRDRSGMNCSDGVADALSAHLRALCDDAIRTAAADGRKTVLDRDVSKPRSG